MAGTALVTGATGLVGRALMAELGEGAVAFAGDVADGDALARALDEHAPEIVFHLGARTVGGADVWRVNVDGTRAVVTTALAGSARVIVASSVAAYASPPPGAPALTEDMALVDPDDRAAAPAYARSKAAADAVARAAGATVARLTNVYGSGDRNASRLIPELVAAAREQRPPRLRSDAATRIDLLHVDDAAAALVALAQAGGHSGEAYNIGAGETTTIASVVATAERILGRPLHPRYGSDRTERPAISIDKIARDTGWRPQITLDEGLRRTL